MKVYIKPEKTNALTWAITNFIVTTLYNESNNISLRYESFDWFSRNNSLCYMNCTILSSLVIKSFNFYFFILTNQDRLIDVIGLIEWNISNVIHMLSTENDNLFSGNVFSNMYELKIT